MMAKALSRGGQAEEGAKEKGLDPANLDGTVTLVGLEPWGDVPCFHLRTAVTIKNPAIPHFIGEGSTEIVSDQLLPRGKRPELGALDAADGPLVPLPHVHQP